MRGEDAQWYRVPTPSHPRPQALPLARWPEPRRTARFQKWKLQERKLHGRRYCGAQVAAFASAVVCNSRLGE